MVKAREQFTQEGFVISTGARYLVGYVGTKEKKKEWLDRKIEK